MIAREVLAASAERSRQVADRWRESDAHRAALAALAVPDPQDIDALVDVAAALLGDAAWVAALLAPLFDALVADPWFEPPLRVHRDGLRLGAVLLDAPAVAITASVLSADALAAAPAPRTVVLSGRVSVVRYHRAGEAVLHRWREEPVGDAFSAADAAPVRRCPALMLADGMVLRHDGRVEGHLLAAARSDVATVTATLRSGAAPLMREHALDGGGLVRTAVLDDTPSRIATLLALLRVSGRADAGEQFAVATRDDGFQLRWTAMREWLALDLRTALPRLREMTDDPHAEIRAAARATLPLAEAALCRA